MYFNPKALSVDITFLCISSIILPRGLFYTFLLPKLMSTTTNISCLETKLCHQWDAHDCKGVENEPKGDQHKTAQVMGGNVSCVSDQLHWLNPLLGRSSSLGRAVVYEPRVSGLTTSSSWLCVEVSLDKKPKNRSSAVIYCQQFPQVYHYSMLLFTQFVRNEACLLCTHLLKEFLH